MSRLDDDLPHPVRVAIDPAEFPAVEGFLTGYLNEDFAIEYGSPVGAMDAFLADAGPEDHVQLALEWAAVHARLEPLDEEHRLDAFGHLGASWQPDSWDQVEEVFARLDQALEE